jgi:hypothetical protein
MPGGPGWRENSGGRGIFVSKDVYCKNIYEKTF